LTSSIKSRINTYLASDGFPDHEAMLRDNQPHHQPNPTVTQPKHEKTGRPKPETIRLQYQRRRSNFIWQQLSR